MDLQLTGKRALITGGSKGIGLAVAAQLAREGVNLVIAGRDETSLLKTVAGLGANGSQTAAGVGFDAADDASVAELVKKAVQILGGLDILVNSAAVPDGGVRPPSLAEINDDLFWNDINVKVMGYLRTAREAAPHMIRGGWGRIVNVGGLTNRRAGSTIGSIRNASVTALTKNLADELGPHGINVTAVHPAFTITERSAGVFERRAAETGTAPGQIEAGFARLTSVGRIITAAEVADVITFMCSPRSVAINGDGIAAGGGLVGSIYY